MFTGYHAPKMKLLIVSIMLWLLNASPIQEPSGAANGLEKSTFSFMSKLFRPKNDLIEVPPGLEQKIAEKFKDQQLSVSFKIAKKIARQQGASNDQAYILAIRYHDPSADGFSIVKKWMRMKDSSYKDHLKENMMLNPTLGKLLGLEPSPANFISAIEEGKSDMVEYFIVRGVKPNWYDFLIAVEKGYLDILKILIGKGGVTPENYHLITAMIRGDAVIVEYLVNFGGFSLTQKHLEYAIQVKSPTKVIEILKRKIANTHPK